MSFGLIIVAVAKPAPPVEGTAWWVYAAIVGGVVLVGAIVLILATRKSQVDQFCPSCKRMVLADWARCKFCQAPLRELRAELEFVSGPLVGTQMSLDRDVTSIGSADTNTIPLTDTGVSRKHCGIRRVDGGYELADLGSTNGVYVNGNKVARHKLEIGDVIRVGTTEMVFRA